MKLIILTVSLLIISISSQAQSRSKKWNDNRMIEVVEDATNGIIGDWKLRDAQYNPVRNKVQLVNYRHVTKEYGLERFSFREDHTFSWTSTRDSTNYTGTWEVISHDRQHQTRTWGSSAGYNVLDDNIRWATDLSIKFNKNGESTFLILEALVIYRRFSTPVKFEYTFPVPNKGKDYVSFFFVRDDNNAVKD